MYFNDYPKKSNMNLGQRGISNKDDFLRQMKEDDIKEKENKIKDKAAQKIAKFLHKNLHINIELKNSKLNQNIQCIISILQSNKYNANQNEQIALKTLSKVINEVNIYLTNHIINKKIKYDIVSNLSILLSYINDNTISTLLSTTEYNSCKKLTNARINNETVYTHVLLMQKANILLRSNMKTYLNTYFIRNKLAALQDKVFNMATSFAEVNNAV